MADELSIEERAQIMGHVPLEEFKGNPDKWVPAEQWVERAEKLLPINKAMLHKLTEDVASLKEVISRKEASASEEIATLKTTLKEFAEFSKQAEERAFKKALAEVERKQREAVENSDMEAFDSAKAELDELKKHPAVTGVPVIAEPEVKPKVEEGWPKVMNPEVFKQWINESEWYREEPEMAAYAHQMDAYLSNTASFPTQRDQLDKVTELVKKKFPDKFVAPVNENRSKPPTVEGGGEGGDAGSRKGKKTYNDLPADARRYCDEWAGKDGKGGTIPGFTRQDYIDQYFGKE